MSTSRRLRSLLLVAGGSFVLAACGGGNPSPSASSAPIASPTPVATETQAPTPSPIASPVPSPSVGEAMATTGRIVNASDGYAVTLPDGWQRVDLNEQDLESIMEAGSQVLDPDARALFEGQFSGMIASGMTFFAFDLGSIGPHGVSTLNVLSIPTGGFSLDLFEQVLVGQLEASLPDIAGGVAQERVQLPAGEAIALKYRLAAPDVGGTAIDVTVRQYLLLDGSTGHVFTVSGPDSDAFSAVVAEIAESIDLLD